MGIPVFLILMILVVLFPFLSRRIYWLSSSYRLPDVRPPNIIEKGWFNFLHGSFLFAKTAIIIGFAGWILLGMILLSMAGLIMFHDLTMVFSSNLTFTFRIFSSNFVPLIIGMLLIFSGGWFAKCLHVDLAEEGADNTYSIAISSVLVFNPCRSICNSSSPQYYCHGDIIWFYSFLSDKEVIIGIHPRITRKEKSRNRKTANIFRHHEWVDSIIKAGFRIPTPFQRDSEAAKSIGHSGTCLQYRKSQMYRLSVAPSSLRRYTVSD